MDAKLREKLTLNGAKLNWISNDLQALIPLINDIDTRNQLKNIIDYLESLSLALDKISLKGTHTGKFIDDVTDEIINKYFGNQ